MVSLLVKNTGATPVITSVTDNATPTNLYTSSGAWVSITTGGNTYWSTIWSTKLARVPALLTVTGTLSASQPSFNVDIVEFSGIASLDLASYIGGGSVSSAAVSLTPVLAQPNEMLFCGVMPQNSCLATAPWVRSQSGFINCCTFYNQLGSVTGSQPQNVGTLTAGYWVASMIGLLPVVVPVTPPVAPSKYPGYPKNRNDWVLGHYQPELKVERWPYRPQPVPWPKRSQQEHLWYKVH